MWSTSQLQTRVPVLSVFLFPCFCFLFFVFVPAEWMWSALQLQTCVPVLSVCVSFILFIKVLFPVALDDGRGAVITKSCEQVSLLLF